MYRKTLAQGLSLLLIGTTLSSCSLAARGPLSPAEAIATSARAEATQTTIAGAGALDGLIPQGPVARDLTALQTQLEAYVETLDGIYGIHVIDLETGATASVHADLAFPAASTFKVPMAMYILHLVEQKQASLSERIAYDEVDWEEGTGTLQENIAPGDPYSVRQLIELAITQSDNIATNMLLRRFGRKNVYAYMRQMGGTVTQSDDGSSATTPREMGQYLQLFYSRKAIASADLHRFLLDRMTRTAFNDRIKAGVPKGVRVAHKIGTLPGVVNDVGLVLSARRSFVLSIYSMDVEEEAATEAIAQITRMVYDFEEGRQ